MRTNSKGCDFRFHLEFLKNDRLKPSSFPAYVESLHFFIRLSKKLGLTSVRVINLQIYPVDKFFLFASVFALVFIKKWNGRNGEIKG